MMIKRAICLLSVNVKNLCLAVSVLGLASSVPSVLKASAMQIISYEGQPYFHRVFEGRVSTHPIEEFRDYKANSHGLIAFVEMEKGEDGEWRDKGKREIEEASLRMLHWYEERQQVIGRLREVGIKIRPYFIYKLSLEHGHSIYGVPFFEWTVVETMFRIEKDPKFKYLKRLFKKIPPSERQTPLTVIERIAVNPRPIACISHVRQDLIDKLESVISTLLTCEHDPDIEMFADL